MTDRGADGVTLAEKASYRTSFGRGFDNDQLAAARLYLVLCGCKTFVLRCATGAKELGAALRTSAAGYRRTHAVKRRGGIYNLAFGLTFDTIGFHKIAPQPKDNVPFHFASAG